MRNATYVGKLPRWKPAQEQHSLAQLCANRKTRTLNGKKYWFFAHIQTFFLDIKREITDEGLKWTKGWKWLQKVFRPAFRCAQHPKASQNTQQVGIWNQMMSINGCYFPMPFVSTPLFWAEIQQAQISVFSSILVFQVKSVINVTPLPVFPV